MKKLAFLFVLTLVFSCSNVQKSPIPDPLFSKEKMASLLTDLYIVEGAIASNKTAYVASGVLPSSYMYSKYDMDSITFKENLDYYTDRVEDYLIIMEQVQDNLKVLQDSVNARQVQINKEEQDLIPKNTIKDRDSISKKKGFKK